QDDAKKQAFHNDMINLYKRTNKELKYKSTKLLDMINKYGGYEAAIKFIKSESNKFDFTILWENERLDLSVEGLITNIKYRELFPDEVISFCDKKLKEYNFSPKKLMEEKSNNIDQMLKDVFDELNEINPPTMQTPSHKDYPIYSRPIEITKETWKELFSNNVVFTDKNKDLVLRIYLMEGYVEAEDISEEEGYTNKYPYKEVVMALAKRIKAKVKIEVPKSRKGEILWWHLLFLGGFKDNTNFEWRIRLELKEAIEELIAEGKVEINQIEVKTHKPLEELISDDIEEDEETKPIAESKLEAKITPIIEAPKVKETKIEEPKIQELKIEEPEVEEVKDTSSIDSFIDSLMGEDFIAIKPVKAEKAVKTKKLTEVSASIEVQNTEVFREKLFSADEKKTTAQKTSMDTPKEIVIEENKEQTNDEIEKLKKECLEYYGAICEICGFDYGYTYGEGFESKIDIHHIQATCEEEILLHTDPIKDLIPICHNCHCIVHSKTPPYSVDEMRVMLKNAH
ncbi:MAG: hypothetical protein RSD26_00585, partial [Cellulosilyticaceae bacterium]